MKLTPFFKNLLWAAPFYFATIVPFLALAQAFKFNFKAELLLYGALGWWIAFLLRIPILFLIQKKDLKQPKANQLTIGVSGPTEEITRYLLLTMIGLTSENAFYSGLGWAMIEIIYALIQVIGLGILDQKTDAKAQEAKRIMKQMGMDKTLLPSTPFWGALERLSANAIHIGFSLLLLWSPFVLILTIPTHSLINFYVVKTNRISLKKSQLTLLLVGCIILGSGILLL